MRNFVQYGEQGQILPSLFIGVVAWPDDWHHDFHQGVVYGNRYVVRPENPQPSPVYAEFPEYITLTQHQTAGHMCNQVRLFGVFFDLRKRDQLMTAAMHHGEEGLWSPAPWPAIVAWESALKGMGMGFDNKGYQHMQEAFVPLSAQDAFRHAQHNATGLLTPGEAPTSDWHDTFPDFDALKTYILDAWKAGMKWRPDGANERSDAFAELRCIFSGDLVGAIVYENSD